MADKYPKQQIHRMPTLEENLGIELSAVAATLDVGENEICITIVGEVIAPSGLSSDLEIVAVLYDDDGDALAREQTYIFRDKFAGFDTFSIWVSNLATIPARIRVYPRAD